jgi:hypothetical protein
MLYAENVGGPGPLVKPYMGSFRNRKSANASSLIAIHKFVIINPQPPNRKSAKLGVPIRKSQIANPQICKEKKRSVSDQDPHWFLFFFTFVSIF